MKKSSGTPTRTNLRGPDAPARPVPDQNGKGPRRRRNYLAAGGAIIILILMILPCQYRRCGGTSDRRMFAYRWVLSGIPSSMADKKPVDSGKRPDYSTGKNRYLSKRVSPHRRTVPVERKDLHDAGDAKEKSAVKPGDRPEQLGKIETAERGAVKPDDSPVQKGRRGADEKDAVRPPDRPKVFNFGTKLELVPAPETR